MASDLPSLVGRVCLVTGASRGIGRGIALMLAKAGATVYITGRKVETLQEVASEVESGSGKCIPVECDHSNDNDVENVFDQIKLDQNGHLDVLVNNAYKGVQSIMDNVEKPFYEQPLEMWDEINNVGLRSNYVAAYYAAKMMVPNKQGLIVNISSFGGLSYLFNIPYGVGKAANDRMMADMAIELKKSNIAAISLWPGAVKTETITAILQSDKPGSEKMIQVFKDGEDVTYAGKAVAWLAADPNVMKKSGRVLIVAELAKEYGFTDVGGAQHLSFRQVKQLAQHYYPSMAWLVPEFLYIPFWFIGATTHRFSPPSKFT
ncbi:dehydrogenase/reductase SDR family member 1-like [Actinia tenebrosa]|uniref:Dehydrogenase/reductase SDR family member 1-like n=1 Tax=Actinia tenebrosa TaxID=6105 RepID=A0A6P8IZ65_ACTTE|nr:dehydrogenase/reductase SDR family member 1-like [Actinia tenebrosa]